MSRIDKFVFDTNALISSVLVKNSIPFKAFDKVQLSGYFVFSEETFLEFESVLFRKKFDRYVSIQERLSIIEKIQTKAIILEAISDFKICRDPKDNKFLNIAYDSKASCIITGDDDLLILHPFNEIQILSPAQFLNF